MAYFDRNTIKALVQAGSLTPFQREKVIRLEGKSWLDAIEREVGHKAQRPSVTLADLQTKAKALSAAIKKQADVMKSESEHPPVKPDTFWR